MNAMKTAVMLAFLGAVGYVVYLSITKNPRQAPDQAAAPAWPAAPKSQLTAPGALMPTVSAGATAGTPAMTPPGAYVGPTMPAAAPPLLPSPGAPPVPSDPSLAGSALPSSDGVRTLPPPPTSSMAPSPGSVYDNANTHAPHESPPVSSAVAVAPADARFDAEMVAQFNAIMAAVRTRLDEGKLDEGLQTLSRLYEMPSLPEAQWREVAELIGQVAGTVIYSRQHVLRAPHRVEPGETLEQIAARYQLTPELVARINGLDAALPLLPGQELKVLPGPFEAVVSLDRRELVVYLRGLYAGRFPIGIGRDSPKLEGEYGVRLKLAGPAYHGSDNATAPPFDPNNPLGRFSLDLGDGVAIHGTNDPSAIGRTDNRGTISLGDRDLEDVANILTIGSKVTIQR